MVHADYSFFLKITLLEKRQYISHDFSQNYTVIILSGYSGSSNLRVQISNFTYLKLALRKRKQCYCKLAKIKGSKIIFSAQLPFYGGQNKGVFRNIYHWSLSFISTAYHQPNFIMLYNILCANSTHWDENPISWSFKLMTQLILLQEPECASSFSALCVWSWHSIFLFINMIILKTWSPLFILLSSQTSHNVE